MSNKDEGKGSVPSTRRNWIKAIAIAGGAGTMAGCLGDDDDDEPADDDDDEVAPGDDDTDDDDDTPVPDDADLDDLVPPGELVNIDERNEELQNIIDDERTRELAEEQAWIYNQWVHSVQTESVVRGQYVSGDPWEWNISSVAPEYNAEQSWSYLQRTQHLRHQSGDPDQFFEMPALAGLEGAHFNFAMGPWLPGNHFFLERVLFEEPAFYSPTTTEFFASGFEDWDFGHTSAEVQLRDDLSWNKQDIDLTVDDLLNLYRILEARGLPPGDWVTDWEVHDDYSITFEYPESRIQEAKVNILGDVWGATRFTVHPVHHIEYVERLEDGEDPEDVTADLSDFQIDGDTAVEEGVAVGPVEITSVEPNRIECEFVDDYPFGEIGNYDDMPNEPNWAGFAFTDHGEDEIDYQQAAVNNEIHAFTGDAPETVRDNMPDHFDIFGFPSPSYTCIHFSPDASPWGDDTQEGRAVRQAIAHMYDPSIFVEIVGADATELPKPNIVTGMNEGGQNAWLGDVLGDLTDYGSVDGGWSNMEHADALMEAAGYEREDGNWIDEDGDPLETELHFPAEWTAVEPAIRNIGSQLEDFGIPTEVVGQQSGTLENQTMPNGDFELAFLTSGNVSPWTAYPNVMGDTSAQDGARYNNGLSEVTVPWPPTWQQ